MDTGLACNVSDAGTCGEGLLCEQVGAERFLCLPPVIVRGHVIEAGDGMGVAEATIVALDANGAARSRVARSAVDGSYDLPVSMKRAEDGSPLSDRITLRVAASDHQPFPTAPRTALAIDLSEAVAHALPDAGVAQEGDAGALGQQLWVVQNAATEVELIELPAAQLGGATLSGKVLADNPGGVLVLAVGGERSRSSAISDSDGSFVLFNVPAGPSVLEGYRAGLMVEPKTVSVPAAGLSDLVLTASAGPFTTVKGSVSLVNAGGGLTTSVILVVASTFDPQVARGETPAGLRVGNVSGAFAIPGVPPGRYAVLAAFENDGLVRDPDESIGGTEIVFVDVAAGASEISLDQGFKVTGALAVEGPGAESVEKVAAGTLTLRWADDSSEDGYELRIYDALGNLAHEKLDVARVTGTPRVTYTLSTSELEPGMTYQFRVKSWREAKGTRTYISATEDLRGVFVLNR